MGRVPHSANDGAEHCSDSCPHIAHDGAHHSANDCSYHGSHYEPHRLAIIALNHYANDCSYHSSDSGRGYY